MDFLVLMEQGEDGYIVVECPQLPGCISQGKTRKEALQNIEEAIRGILAVRKEHGFSIPDAEIIKLKVA